MLGRGGGGGEGGGVLSTANLQKYCTLKFAAIQFNNYGK